MAGAGEILHKGPQTREKIKTPDHFAVIRGRGVTNMFEGIDKSVNTSGGKAKSSISALRFIPRNFTYDHYAAFLGILRALILNILLCRLESGLR
jgi:hypothetical protein